MSLFQPLWQPAETSAASIPFTPAGTIAATTVQAAIEELDAEKSSITADAASFGSGTATDNFVLTADGAGGAAWEAAAAGSGDVIGPASSTDNALARFHETGGKTLQNSAATLSDNGALTLTGTTVTVSEPILNVTQTWNNSEVTFSGLKANVTDTASATDSVLLDLQVGAVSQSLIYKGGFIGAKGLGLGTSSSSYRTKWTSTQGFLLSTVAGVGYHWGGASSFSLSGTVTPDLSLLRDAANTLAQRNSTTAQTYRLYNTYTDASNYERLALVWDSNTAKIQTEAAGTGTLRDLFVGASGGKLAFLGATPVARQAHIADADTAHAINATFSDTEVEAALNALGTKLNSILAILEAFGLQATS
jgi:hypothetical protein